MGETLVAKEGYVYTNGETASNIIRLGCLDKPENWWEITEEAYNKILKAKESEEM